MIDRYQWAVIDIDLNPSVGSEQGGRRPVLVVCNEPFKHHFLQPELRLFAA